MNNNWKKLLQLSMPKEGHGASSTGILEDTNPNRSILDLGIKSPRVAAPPTNTGPGEVTRLNPAPPASPAPYWEGPRATSNNGSTESIGSSVEKIGIYCDNDEPTGSGDESSGVQLTNQSLLKNVAQTAEVVELSQKEISIQEETGLTLHL